MLHGVYEGSRSLSRFLLRVEAFFHWFGASRLSGLRLRDLGVPGFRFTRFLVLARKAPVLSQSPVNCS